jgi:enamine deaminase RidA (YjgF/YER057c/UK114 family)
LDDNDDSKTTVCISVKPLNVARLLHIGITKMTKQALEPTHFPFFDYKGYSFSLGLETAAGIWLSGHTASRYAAELDRMVVAGEGDIVAQAHVSHDKISAILQAAGLGLGDVVRLVDYVTLEGMTQYARLAGLRQELFGNHRPVINTVVVHRLLRPTAFIEIEAVASRDGSKVIGATYPATHGVAGRQMGDVVYLSTQLPLQPETQQIVAPGDIVGQTRQIYENAGQLLQQAGLGWEHVVKTVEFLTPAGRAQYADTGRIRREFLAPQFPAATGIIMPRAAHPEALLQVDFVACRQPKAVINPGWSRYEQLTYAPATKAGHLLSLSGQGAINPESNEIECPDDIVGQTRYVYSNLMKVLDAAGVGPEAVVKTVEFVTPVGLRGYRDTANVRREFFQTPLPAATGIVCGALLRPEMLIEVDAWAIVPQG